MTRDMDTDIARCLTELGKLLDAYASGVEMEELEDMIDDVSKAWEVLERTGKTPPGYVVKDPDDL